MLKPNLRVKDDNCDLKRVDQTNAKHTAATDCRRGQREVLLCTIGDREFYLHAQSCKLAELIGRRLSCLGQYTHPVCSPIREGLQID